MNIGRFEELGALGTGAMGQVRRVRDPDLNRVMALKVIHYEFVHDDAAVERFMKEAQATAQLEHPGIVPVHEFGVLDDGRLFYTMQEVKGRTLAEVITEVHAGKAPVDQGGGHVQWSLRRLIDAFHQVCVAVGYAHDQGVLHRDIKPENIMLGDYGEVLVVDWGLAKLLDDVGDEARIQTQVDAGSGTRFGEVIGTPMYMPPEQASGEASEHGTWSDVYSLGVVLYEVLCGHAPFAGGNPFVVLANVLAGRVEPMQGSLPVPPELVEVCRRAMSIGASDRYPTGGALATEAAQWLNGTRRRERARRIIADADKQYPRIAALRAEANRLRETARTLLADVRAHDSVSRKQPGWDAEDEADALVASAQQAEITYTQILRSALLQAPELPDAMDRLATFYRARHEAAEAAGDALRAAEHAAALAEYDRGSHSKYLDGACAVTLVTDPPGAEAVLYRYVRRARRLEAVEERSLGRTPLVAVQIPNGSWCIELRAEGHAVVRYPVQVNRLEHWDGCAPGSTETVPIRLPKLDELGDREVYVPAGWALLGGDAEVRHPRPASRTWIDGFVIQQFPVTNQHYLDLMNDLVADGLEEEAMRVAPQATTDGSRYSWRLDSPVVRVNAVAANAFAAWRARRTGAAWRLPTEDEWEKAARGVDGRRFPWGDFLDPTWCAMGLSQPLKPVRTSVTAHTSDVSPYGVRGLAGNVRDWTGTVFGDGPERVVKGGAYDDPIDGCRAASRLPLDPDSRSSAVSFRLLRPFMAG
ncbi:MAG: serine/threonine protein kinase [Myxococcota bacterium]|jgi:serine/threonine protein kinase